MNQKKVDEFVTSFKRDVFDKNIDLYIPDEEINAIIELVKSEKDNDLLRIELINILLSYASKVNDFNVNIVSGEND